MAPGFGACVAFFPDWPARNIDLRGYGEWGVVLSEIIDLLDRRSRLYRASRVIHEATKADLRETVIDALNAGYKVHQLVDLVSFSRQNLYEIAKSIPAKQEAE